MREEREMDFEEKNLKMEGERKREEREGERERETEEMRKAKRGDGAEGHSPDHRIEISIQNRG